MAGESSAFLTRLHKDRSFRERFAAEPAAVLAEAGVDADAFALPDKIDPDTLAARLERLFAGAEPEPGGSQNVGELTPQELWDRHGAIAWKENYGPGDRKSAPAMVIYGGFMASSVRFGNTTGVMSVEQLAALRALSRQRPAQLTFSVTGADGARVDGLTAAAMNAFLSRLK